MTLASLTRHQVWLYLAAFITALAVGSQWPTVSDSLDRAIWPVLGLLLYVTFVLIPFDRVREALRDKRFLAASVVGNFLVIPPLVGVATLLLPDSDALRLGVFLVLAVPCTDWFITFSMLVKGSPSHALSV